MMNIIVPILGAVALTFVVAGTLCLLADARSESSEDQRARKQDERAKAQAKQPSDQPRSTV